jgi:exodeoxyribonuclease VII large subunit
VADHRAPTPSAAAEIVVAARDEFVARIDRLRQRSHAAAAQRLGRARAVVHQLDARPAFAGFRGGLAMRSLQAAELAAALARCVRDGVLQRERRYQALKNRLDGLDLRHRMARLHNRLGRADAAIQATVSACLNRANVRMRSAAGRLDSLSPLGVLGRGYALCWRADARTLVRDAADVAPGDAVRITLRRGALACTVDDRTESDAPGT